MNQIINGSGRYGEAILDYEAASNLFNVQQDIPRYSDARANLALALYADGRKEEAVKVRECWEEGGQCVEVA